MGQCKLSRLKNILKEQSPKLVVAGAGGSGNGEKLFDGYRVSFWGAENVLELDRNCGFTTW